MRYWGRKILMVPGLHYPYRYTLYRNDTPIYSSYCVCNIVGWKNSEERKDKNFYPTINFNYKIKDNQKESK